MLPLDFDDTAGYMPLRPPRRITRRHILYALLIIFLISLMWLTTWKADNIILRTKKPDGTRPLHTFISALYGIDTELRYYRSLTVLLYSLQKHHPDFPKHVMYLNGSPLPNVTLCQLEVQGWTPLGVDQIPAPSKNVLKHFEDQFTKLNMWNMMQFDGIVYLDADTLVRGPVDHVFSLLDHWPIAGVADNWFGEDARHINGGMLVLQPNNKTFAEMLVSYSRDVDKYYISFAEQGFLNYFFRHRLVRLPEIYNLNVALYHNDTAEWDHLLPDARVIHYTWVKPTMLESEITDNEEYLKTRVELRNTMIPWLETEVEMVRSEWWNRTKAAMEVRCGHSNESDIVKYIEERAGLYLQGRF